MENVPTTPDWQNIASRLRRQLVIERSCIGLILLVFLGRWGYSYVTSSSYMILADKKPIVVVESKRIANELLDEMLNPPGTTAESPEFGQDISIKRIAGRTPMDRESAQAVLKTKIRVLADKWVILIDKKPVAAVDTQQQAGETLELARERYGKLVPNLAEEPSFKEDVTTQLQKADLRHWRRSPEQAIELLFNPEDKPAVHVVKKGEIAGTIAEKYGMTLAKMKTLNPGRHLDKLQIGDKLRVGAGQCPLTVVVRNLINRTELIPAPTQSVTSMRLYTGKTYLISKGRPGKRQVKIGVTYENGVQTGKEVIEEVVLRTPVPKRVAVGVKPRR